MLRDDLQAKLGKYYREQQSCGDEFQIRDLVHIQAGWENEIYAFDLQSRGKEPQALIMRIYPGADAVEKSIREFYNLKRLANANFPVPKAHILEDANTPIGDPFIIMERVPGKTLWASLFSGKQAEQQNLIDTFNQLYVQLHRVNFQPFIEEPGTIIAPGSMSGVSSQLKILRVYYDSFPLPDFLPLLNWLEDHAAEIETAMPAVLHWDFHPENIILRPDGSMIVIDWTGRCIRGGKLAECISRVLRARSW
jgi:aminoglycoside phosphotransferase (APT) family kinase protein